jgi:hypothetical protein
LKDFPHSIFLIFLLAVGAAAIISLSVKGWNYYLTPMEMRPFHPEYSSMKPSGTYSIGLGIIGSVMIIVGVAIYSTRKRVRALAHLGRLSWWLEFHIFLCLVGPILVVYHTTFKAGGIAAITLWTMVSVVGSGVLGRFLYVLLPRNLNGTALTIGEIEGEIKNLSGVLQASPIGSKLIEMIDTAFAPIPRPTTMMQTVSTVLHLEMVKIQTNHNIQALITKSRASQLITKQVRKAASTRASLLQKSLVLSQVERIFYFWHVIHLPFAIIMFITLGLHVAVGIALGYRWIF